MFLSLSTLPTYLISRGHVGAREWIHGKCRLWPTLGRHRNFEIERESEPGLFLKQVPRITDELVSAQNNEAMMLAELEHSVAWESIRELAPRLVNHDRNRHVLLLERLSGESFYKAYVSIAHRAPDQTRLMSIAAGKRLARFHNTGRAVLGDPGHPELRNDLPAAITLQTPQGDSTIGPACQQILQAIQSDEAFFMQLRANQTQWKPETVIHGDMKWDNLMVSEGTNTVIRFVDWELAGIGDPAWDVAGVLQNYLIYDVDQATTSPLPTQAQSDADSLWHAYRGDVPDDPYLKRRVRCFFAARLIQSALERERQSQLPADSTWQLIAISRLILCGGDWHGGEAPVSFLRGE